ncbi:MAG: hypothetical protein IKN81_02175 [Oscillospiraceae bacterium]|nr:hypothetical protein [Oscillospiraceae bacterium]
MKLRNKAMSAALALMLTAALPICADASDYSFKGAMAPEYYPSTSYDEVYGSRYNYGGKNVSDYQIPELPYGTYSNTSIGIMEKVRLPGQTVSYGGLAVDFGGISGAVSGSTITVAARNTRWSWETTSPAR